MPVFTATAPPWMFGTPLRMIKRCNWSRVMVEPSKASMPAGETTKFPPGDRILSTREANHLLTHFRRNQAPPNAATKRTNTRCYGTG